MGLSVKKKKDLPNKVENPHSPLKTRNTLVKNETEVRVESEERGYQEPPSKSRLSNPGNVRQNAAVRRQSSSDSTNDLSMRHKFSAT